MVGLRDEESVVVVQDVLGGGSVYSPRLVGVLFYVVGLELFAGVVAVAHALVAEVESVIHYTVPVLGV